MRSPIRIWGVVLVLVVLHFFLHLGLGLGPLAPDLLTVALLMVAREVPMGVAAGIGFVFGLLEDAFSLLAFGGNAIALTIVGAAGARTRELFVGDSLLFLVSYLFLGKWFRDLIHWVAVGESLREPFVDAMLVDSSIAALYVVVVGGIALSVSGAWWESLR